MTRSPTGNRPVIGQGRTMAYRNSQVLLTIGLAQVEGDTDMYTRASDKDR